MHRVVMFKENNNDDWRPQKHAVLLLFFHFVHQYTLPPAAKTNCEKFSFFFCRNFLLQRFNTHPKHTTCWKQNFQERFPHTHTHTMICETCWPASINSMHRKWRWSGVLVFWYLNNYNLMLWASGGLDIDFPCTKFCFQVLFQSK